MTAAQPMITATTTGPSHRHTLFLFLSLFITTSVQRIKLFSLFFKKRNPAISPGRNHASLGYFPSQNPRNKKTIPKTKIIAPHGYSFLGNGGVIAARMSFKRQSNISCKTSWCFCIGILLPEIFIKTYNIYIVQNHGYCAYPVEILVILNL